MSQRYKSHENWRVIANISESFMQGADARETLILNKFSKIASCLDITLQLEASLHLNQKAKVKKLLDRWRPSQDWSYFEPHIKKLLTNTK